MLYSTLCVSSSLRAFAASSVIMSTLARRFVAGIIFFLSVAWFSAPAQSPEHQDTIFIRYPRDQEFAIPRRHRYHQTLTLKLFMSQAGFDGKLKRKDNGASEVSLNFEQTLDVLRRIDNLTLGIPKIVYLVGWQYNGHDSKYPAWFEANEKLKRAQDPNAMESLKWLMREAEKLHTTVSVHINMFDAYEDSPLWDEYVKNNIIARNADGSLRAAEWGYPISYAQEWKTRFAQKRIDLICELLPLKEAGTVHIDAFHTWPPTPKLDASGKYDIDLGRNVTSPFLNFTVEDEAEAQRNIFKYWASKGVDVTSETVDVLRASSFAGYQPMAWWFSGGLKNYLAWPAEFYCGGKDKSDWGKLFGTSMHGEAIVKNDFKGLSGFKEEFCLNTAVWYYLNQLKRLYVIDKDFKLVQFSDHVTSYLSKDQFKITQGPSVLVENNNVLIPARWINENSLIAYSKEGYQNKEWTLPSGWESVKSVKVRAVGTDGKGSSRTEKVISGRLMLSVGRDEMLLVEK